MAINPVVAGGHPPPDRASPRPGPSWSWPSPRTGLRRPAAS